MTFSDQNQEHDTSGHDQRPRTRYKLKDKLKQTERIIARIQYQIYGNVLNRQCQVIQVHDQNDRVIVFRYDYNQKYKNKIKVN